MSAESGNDILTDDKLTEFMPKLIDYLSDKGFDLIGHSRDHQKVADSAIDEGEQSSSSQRGAAQHFHHSLSWLVCLYFFVLFLTPFNVSSAIAMSLKRLLVGSISLSDDMRLDELIGEEQAEGIQQNADSCQSTGQF